MTWLYVAGGIFLFVILLVALFWGILAASGRADRDSGR